MTVDCRWQFPIHIYEHNVYYLFVGLVCCELYDMKAAVIGMNTYTCTNIYIISVDHIAVLDASSFKPK